MIPVVYAWSGPGMRAALCVAFLANLAAFQLTSGLLPYITQDVSSQSQTGLGYLSASFAVGSLIGSTTVSLARGLLIGRLLIVATFAWYAILLIFVEVTTLPVGMICLVAAGIAQSMSMISAAVILMRTASPYAWARDGRPHDGDLWAAAWTFSRWQPVGALIFGPYERSQIIGKR